MIRTNFIHKTIQRGAFIAAVICGSFLINNLAHAETFTVTSSLDNGGDCYGIEIGTGAKFCTLRQAINEANDNAGEDEIIVKAGTYNITPNILVDEDDNTRGDLDITDDVIIRVDSGLAPSGFFTFSLKTPKYAVIDGGESFRVFHVHNGVNVTFDRVVMREGASVDGGCLKAEANSVIILRDSELRDCGASQGGGIHFAGNELIIERSTLVDNESLNEGGALYTDTGSDVSMTNVTISGNIAQSGGGGIWHDGNQLELRHVTLADNSDNSTAASLHVAAGTVNVYNSLFAHEADDSPLQDQLCSVDVGAQLLSFGGNLGADSSCNLTQSSDQKDVAADEIALEELKSNGGFSQTHALSALSLAIDAGLVSLGVKEDQRQVTRPLGAGPDVGAYEFNPEAESADEEGDGAAGNESDDDVSADDESLNDESLEEAESEADGANAGGGCTLMASATSSSGFAFGTGWLVVMALLTGFRYRR